MLLLGGLLVVGLIFRLAGTEDDAPSPEVDKSLAFNACKVFVERRLKAPATARFRSFYQADGEVTVTGFGDGPYTVRSSVDSENGFGANLRSTFTCTVTRSGDDWRLDNLSIA